MLKGTTNRHVFLPPTVDWSVCNLEVLLKIICGCLVHGMRSDKIRPREALLMQLPHFLKTGSEASLSGLSMCPTKNEKSSNRVLRQIVFLNIFPALFQLEIVQF